MENEVGIVLNVMSYKKTRTNFNRTQSHYSNLPKYIKLVISEFLVNDRPCNINPRYNFNEYNLKLIEFPPKNILMSIITLSQLFLEYKVYYMEVLKGLKLYYHLNKFANLYFDVKLLAVFYGLTTRLESPITDFNFAYLKHKYIGQLKYDGGGELYDDEEEIHSVLFTKLESIPINCFVIDEEQVDNIPIKNVKVAKNIVIENRIPYIPNCKIDISSYIDSNYDRCPLILDSDKFPVLKKNDIKIIAKYHYLRMYFTLTLDEFKKMIGI